LGHRGRWQEALDRDGAHLWLARAPPFGNTRTISCTARLLP
jgi:hypothetical protein